MALDDFYAKYIQWLKIPTKVILSDNYLDTVLSKYATSENLYKYALENAKHYYSTQIILAFWSLPTNYAYYKLDDQSRIFEAKDRFSTLKTTLNTNRITDKDKALYYAYVYYTDSNVKASSCKNIDDLYETVKRLDNYSYTKLEVNVAVNCLSKGTLDSNPKIKCFDFYKKYSGEIQIVFLDEIWAEKLKREFNAVKEAIEEYRKEIQLKQAKAVARKQASAINMTMVYDTLSDMSVDKLKSIYPYCLVITSYFNDGWAQSSSKITRHYFFTNLSKSEAIRLLKEKGVNTKNSSEKYENGFSDDLEWGGTAYATKSNNVNYVLSSMLPEIKVGTDFAYSRYTAGTVTTSYLHVIAKPIDNIISKMYCVKSERPGLFIIPKQQSVIYNTDISGKQSVNEQNVGFKFYIINDDNTTQTELENARMILDTVSPSSNVHVDIEIVRGYIKDENSPYVHLADKYNDYSNDTLRTLYSFTKRYNNRSNCIRLQADSKEKDEVFDCIDKLIKGIPVKIYTEHKKFAIYKEENGKVFLIEASNYFNENSQFYIIDNDVFNNIFIEAI